MADSGRYLTFDLGAESGRAVLGTLAGDHLTLDEIHRFPNPPQRVLSSLHWDALRLFGEMKAGLALCAKDGGGALNGIGVDTWGVDFALLDCDDEVLGQPYHYRDSRTDGVMDRTFETVSREEVYRATGIQFMQINTLYQLMSLKLRGSPLLGNARSLLMMPDLLNFWLTGRRANEATIATTSQCYDPTRRDWAREMLDRLELPTAILGEIVEPGTILGKLHPSAADETGAGSPPVIAPATHDTGSAVAGVPVEQASGDHWAYISCGTWSLVGVETTAPVITDASLRYNLTNEGGVYGATRLLRNVMGLWLLQQCRRSWERAGRSYSYDELAAMTAEAAPFRAVLDPDDPSFLNPPDMPAAIADFCRRTGQSQPDSIAATVRCIVESLALKYRWVIERLEEVTGRRIDTIHVIGGGSQNQSLCQATADACGRQVLAGPVEATAAGNVVVQAIATGRLADLAAGRAAIRRSFSVLEYLPREPDAWQGPYGRLAAILAQSSPS